MPFSHVLFGLTFDHLQQLQLRGDHSVWRLVHVGWRKLFQSVASAFTASGGSGPASRS